MANSRANKNHKNTSKLQQWLENIWYNDGSGRFILMPLTVLYCAVNSFQRYKYSNNKAQTSCPIIVVGNITVGGTGKTPLTIYIVKLLQKTGYKPAIITRGYGGKATTWPQSVNAKSNPQLVGDEAVLMASQTQVPVYAGADRLKSIEQLTQHHDCDVIVSDDGMQHYKLPRDIQIAVIDGERQLGNGYCLPAGPLREKKKRLNACDLIVVNGKSDHKNWYSMRFEGDVLVNLLTAEEKPLAQFVRKKCHALTGIGNPQRFFSNLKKQGLELITHSFPDHHDFIKADLVFDDNDKMVIMTEKDAVKCRDFARENHWYLPVTAKLDCAFDEQLRILLESL
ncbi:MAG: tetraacyldisaccharide 4'-kinase [Cocleimonas sp.]|nr:tetraacyldisaccharide 4'-kinase [Cocleimonas sp.]